MEEIDCSVGRHAFGSDPAGYDRARPDYPQRIYDLLRERCGLCSGTHTFEIGSGTGKATRQLLQMGASPLIAIEPDMRLANFLSTTTREFAGSLEVRNATFEETYLSLGSFDLGVAATSFHWVEQEVAIRKIATALRPGGWWVMWWNVFGDSEQTDEFHEASKNLLASAGSPHRPPFALDRDARIANLIATGEFDDISYETIHWTATFNSAGIRELFATFSEIALLLTERRQLLLNDLAKIADEQFGGRVVKPMVTPIYIARRR